MCFYKSCKLIHQVNKSCYFIDILVIFSVHQRELLLDLVESLREVMNNVLPVISSSSVAAASEDDQTLKRSKALTAKDSKATSQDSDDQDEGEDDEFTPSQRVGLAQSAILCIDILARSLGTVQGQPVPATLAAAHMEAVALSQALASACSRLSHPAVAVVSVQQPAISNKRSKAVAAAAPAKSAVSKAEEEEWHADLLKLMGSVCILCGTLFGVVKAKGLPSLAVSVFRIRFFSPYFSVR